jgi:hypothetical protein
MNASRFLLQGGVQQEYVPCRHSLQIRQSSSRVTFIQPAWLQNKMRFVRRPYEDPLHYCEKYVIVRVLSATESLCSERQLILFSFQGKPPKVLAVICRMRGIGSTYRGYPTSSPLLFHLPSVSNLFRRLCGFRFC